MYKAQKILISLLLLASFASCSSSNSSERQKETLTAQKNHLIDEITDLAVILLKENPDKEIAKAMRLVLSGVCGVLENRESATVDVDFLAKLNLADFERKREVEMFLQVALGGNTELSKEALTSLLSLDGQSEQKIDTAYELYSKMQCLAKVMKQIRELT